jgi:hypothetical protein
MTSCVRTVQTPPRLGTSGVVIDGASADIPELNVILAGWWRPVSGADSGGGG